MQNAIAFSNNDVITIAWSYAKEPTGCMGFALYRLDAKGKAKLLPSHAFFKGYPKTWPADTLHYPIQKFYWKDPYARPEAEATQNRNFRYRIVPLSGKPGKLVPMAGFPILTTNEVTIASCTRTPMSTTGSAVLNAAAAPAGSTTLMLKPGAIRSARRARKFGSPST